MRTTTERSDVIAPLAAVFRAHGFSGASLAAISEGTGLGKGSLYNFFPGGKEEMAQAVLEEVDAWFRQNIYGKLTAEAPVEVRIDAMISACDTYFRSNQLVCLFGAFALGQEKQRFAQGIRRFFTEWTDALALTLRDHGWAPHEANARSVDAVSSIQGALVIARACENPDIFSAVLDRLGQNVKQPAHETP